ncbi:MAG TPA: adenylate/guanylate cyclase domain-containing protein [Rhizomicrobium sp.]|nr:adenylate/guanylate cyclase domain-containing protein [Rhizomicrobium sp.]
MSARRKGKNGAGERIEAGPVRRKVPYSILPGLLVTGILLIAQLSDFSFVTEVRNLVFDAYQRAAPRPYQPVPVKVVDIDDATLAKLGQWPWPRTDVARLTQRLADAGAAAIAFDIVFSEPDRTSPARIAEILRANPGVGKKFDDVASLPDHDVLLGQTFKTTPSVTGYFLTHDANTVRPTLKAGIAVSGTAPLASLPLFQGSIVPLPTIDADARGSGFVSIESGADGIVRAVPLIARIDDQIVPSLSAEALRVAQGAGAIVVKTTTGSGEFAGGEAGIVAVKIGAFEVPTTKRGQLWMYYTEPQPKRVVPAWKILTDAIKPADMKNLFAGNIVIVGAGAVGLRDLVATPISERETGAVVHAEAIEQMILQRFLVRPDWAAGLERSILILLGIAMSLSLAPLGALRGGIMAVVAITTTVAGSWIAFRHSALLIDPTFPAVGVIAVYLADTTFAFYREERARAYIRRAFDHYLSPELVERIARDPNQLELGGEERDMTVMFCDIRSFSHISESLTPREVIRFLNDFLTPLTDVLLARNATIDKFMGDAILAFWNAPLNDPDHHRHAAFAALEMLERLKTMNKEYPSDPKRVWPGEVRIGIGMNSGPCFVGNIGSAQRLNYSLIGDTVNLASRIEGLTKNYGVSIALGHELASRLADFALIEVDLVRVVGRDTPEKLFALIGTPEFTADVEFRALQDGVAAMLTAYRAQDWDGAEQTLDAVAPVAEKLGLAKLVGVYRERVANYRRTPPPSPWDGVYQALTK